MHVIHRYNSVLAMLHQPLYSQSRSDATSPDLGAVALVCKPVVTVSRRVRYYRKRRPWSGPRRWCTPIHKDHHNFPGSDYTKAAEAWRAWSQIGALLSNHRPRVRHGEQRKGVLIFLLFHVDPHDAGTVCPPFRQCHTTVRLPTEMHRRSSLATKSRFLRSFYAIRVVYRFQLDVVRLALVEALLCIQSCQVAQVLRKSIASKPRMRTDGDRQRVCANTDGKD